MTSSQSTHAALSNKYFLLRHGESMANRQGIIVSRLEHGVSEYGLTPEGREGVATQVRNAMRDGVLDGVDLIVSSPFLRARQSAEIAGEILDVPVEVDERLRERHFGELEMTSHDNYEKVWVKDIANPCHTEWGVESVTAVLERAAAAVAAIEARLQRGTVLLATHGDIASILLCGFLGESMNRHRQVGAMGVGEVRPLVSVR